MNTQVSGKVYLRLMDGSIGSPLAGTALTFVAEDRSASYGAAGDNNGNYSITLPSARYYVRATHPDYADYSSVPGFVVAKDAQQTCNFFLREPRVTTVVVIRHAEKQNPASTSPTEPLSTLGQQRAMALRDILFRSGISAIRVTDTVRAVKTAEPLARALMLAPQKYNSASVVAGDLLRDHEGDVSLAVAHSNTVRDLVTALGSTVSIGDLGDADFDNMFIVSRAGTQVNVTNLQYGAVTAPSLSKNQAAALTVLLVGTGQAAGTAPQRLLHVARGAGVSAIYMSGNQSAMVAPLASALGLTAVSYGASAILGLVDRLQTLHAKQTVVVSGTPEERREVIQHLRGELPILYPTDAALMIVLTRFGSGAVQVLPVGL